MKNQEFQAFLADPTKQINGDITWQKDEDHSPAVEFRIAMASQARYPIFVRGSCNMLTQTLTYAMIHSKFGRIYALDLGKEHRNPSGVQVGRKHKHRWTEKFRDKEAYEPDDITAMAHDPVAVWAQFCNEAMLTHNGVMYFQHPLRLEMSS
jgi:hypothetical protein